MEKVGIYIHFPFCASKCHYCDFNSYSDKNHLQIDYLKSLVKEISLYSNKTVEVDTIFIGGGTPSLMFDGSISTVLSEIRKNFNVLEDAEITVESNPNSITLSKVREWKECGINRVSVGLQTANNRLLRIVGRAHTKDDYVKAIEIIKSVGINNINTDCLIGLPRQRQSDVKNTLNLITKLGCNHISVYSLILEYGTRLYKMVDSGELKLPKEEKTLSMYNFAYKYLGKLGFSRYEVSNFSKVNYECKHNLNTWNMHKYLGFGAGAHGYFDNYRYSNVLSIEDYISKLKSNKLPIENKEEISNEELLEETIMLGLRTIQGINLLSIKEKFNKDLRVIKQIEIDELLKNGLIEINNDYLKATDFGFTVLNKIILDLV